MHSNKRTLVDQDKSRNGFVIDTGSQIKLRPHQLYSAINLPLLTLLPLKELFTAPSLSLITSISSSLKTTPLESWIEKLHHRLHRRKSLLANLHLYSRCSVLSSSISHITQWFKCIPFCFILSSERNSIWYIRFPYFSTGETSISKFPVWTLFFSR